MSVKFRYVLSFPWDYYRGVQALAQRDDLRIDDTLNRRVLFDLRSDRILVDAGRYFYLLVDAFRQAGIGVDLRKHRWFLARAGRKYFGRLALSMPNVRAVNGNGSTPDPVAILSDWDASQTRILFGNAGGSSGDVFPYPMFPGSYTQANLQQIRADRAHNGQVRVFFSGNLNHKYDNDVLRSKYGVLSRANLIDAVKQQFPSQTLPQQPDQAALSASLQSGDAATIILNDLNQCPVRWDRWLATLSQVDFFLCCPGVAHPLCHNAIEAMAVGTIPIIEFPEQFTPPLQDNVNAITFAGRAGLREAVDRALQLPIEARKKMSQAAIEYYQDHLCIRGFVDRWIERGAKSAIQFPYLPA